MGKQIKLIDLCISYWSNEVLGKFVIRVVQSLTCPGFPKAAKL